MPLKITNPTEQVAVLNKWADLIESELRANKQTGHIAIKKADTAQTTANNIVIPIPSDIDDGLTHGDAVWEHDSAYVELRDDFVPYSLVYDGTGVNGLGQLGWCLTGGGTLNSDMQGGAPPNLGQLAWENVSTVNRFGTLILNFIDNTTTGAGTILNRNSFALLENPGWKQTWVWKHDGTVASTGTFGITKKSFYIGLSGSPVLNIATTGGSARPDIFLGIRYDTSVTPGTLTLASVATGTGAYTGTITGGANGAYIGLTFTVAGFVNGVNNGTFVCTQSSITVLTLANASSTIEVAAATAAGPTGLSDSFYTFEAAINRQYTNPARHNLQGQTFVTNIAPTLGTWHRLDMVCSATGVVTMTLDGSATNTFTVTIPQATVTAGAAGDVSCTSHVARIAPALLATTGTNSVFPFTAGSAITVSGFTAGNAPLNGTWTLFSGDSVSVRFDAPLVSNIGTNTQDCTVVGYPSLTPICVYGNDDTAAPTQGTIRTFVDFFSLVWNPNLGPNAPGTPDKTKARYW